jgi:beta-glucanase (GH16 family)
VNRRKFLITAAAAAGLTACGGSPRPQPRSRISNRTLPPLPVPSPVFTFADEFAGMAGTPPDPSRWMHETGPGAVVGGNHETEFYTDSTGNAYLDGDGHLVIAVTNAPGGSFSSARLRSRYSQLYGHWEVRLAIHNSSGCWPAFWFLGQGQWPGCGEADLMENFGTGFTNGTIWNGTASDNSRGTSAATADTDFHVYRMDWEPESIRFYRDGALFTSASAADLTPWPFHTSMYAIMNIATSGIATGFTNPSPAAMPVKMIIDYVHAWKM